MNNSTLNVEVLDLKEIIMEYASVYVHIFCGGYNLYSEKSEDLKWNENF